MNTVYNGEKDKRLFKSVIGSTIEEIMKDDPLVVWLDADLMGCSGTVGQYGKNEHYINCGIAEANMIGIGCGMSASGLKPFAHSFGTFASRRCFDQVFLSAGYSKNPITVIGTDPGITAAFNGGTHMPFEDVALYRTIPGATIFDITDVPMLKDALWQCKDTAGVSYIRVPRKESFQCYADGSHFSVGRGCVLKDGSDAVIVASGIMVHEAMQAALSLEHDGISVAVIDPITIKPLDSELITDYVQKTKVIVTAENHNKIGGLTSAVQDAICGMQCSFGYVAVEDEFGEVGPQDYLRERFALTDEHIKKVIKELLQKQ